MLWFKAVLPERGLAAELSRLETIYSRLAAVILKTPEASVNSHTIIDGDSVGEMVSELRMIICRVASEHEALVSLVAAIRRANVDEHGQVGDAKIERLICESVQHSS